MSLTGYGFRLAMPGRSGTFIEGAKPTEISSSFIAATPSDRSNCLALTSRNANAPLVNR